MADTVDAETRSRIMRAIKGRDTGPERLLRSLLWRRGLRFRKHRRDLPGTPDAAFASAKVALFVDGDFWHGRHWRERGKAPEANREYWLDKFEHGAAMCLRAEADLRAMGWMPVRVWESDLLRDPGLYAALVEQVVRAREASLAPI